MTIASGYRWRHRREGLLLVRGGSHHGTVWLPKCDREKARTICRPPARYQWHLEKRPARPGCFGRADNSVRLKLEQAILDLVEAEVGALASGASRSRPVDGLSGGRAGGGPKQHASTQSPASVCYFEPVCRRVDVAHCLSGRPKVPRLTLIGRQRPASTRQRPGVSREAGSRRRNEILSSAREHDL